MRVLYVTQDFPYPLTSGHLRHYFLMRELSRHHEVTLLSVVRPTFTHEHAAALEPFTERVLTFLSSTQGQPRGTKVRNQLRALARREPVERAALRMRAAIEELHRTDAFDVAIVSGRRTLPVLAALHDVPVVADLCDADSVRLRASVHHTDAIELPWLGIEYARVRRAERELIARADHLLFAARRDRAALVPQHVPATVVPNGVDAHYWQRSTRTLGTATAVFTGAMQYAPNTDAALWLIREVWPRVMRVRSDARLLIVGRDPPQQLRDAGAHHGVHVTGAVPDVRPWLEQATVFVAPLRFAAGIQNKLLEALAMELPVIASPLAADGLRLDDGERPPLDVAQGADDVARLILHHFARAVDDVAPHTAGRHFVEQYFQWARSGRLLEEVLVQVSERTSSMSVTVGGA